ncbi:MAG: ATP-dependent sacrificial sulfur transferase LarE [Brooklawnia sp.]|jgi:uncharacterized protein
MTALASKVARLREFFHANPRVGLGFSGGVDSSYLLWAGKHAGAELVPYFVRSAFVPQFEADDALRLADHVGVPAQVVPVDILSHPMVAANPADRCYHCKAEIFGTILRLAADAGLPLVIDGSNASDDAGDRPGMVALAELQVRSPLREAGLTKAEIRELSRAAGLFTGGKPSYSCLATRIPTGRRITSELLGRVEGAEQVLFAMGFSDLRVRVFGDLARLQLPTGALTEAAARADEIRAALAPWFDGVLLDLEGR